MNNYVHIWGDWLSCDPLRNQKTAYQVNKNEMKWNESGFRPPLCTYRLNWARRTSWGWLRWHCPPDTGFEIRAEHAISRSRRLPTILTFTRGWGRNIFCFFQTAETGNRTPDSGVKGIGANHYPRAPALKSLKIIRICQSGGGSSAKWCILVDVAGVNFKPCGLRGGGGEGGGGRATLSNLPKWRAWALMQAKVRYRSSYYMYYWQMKYSNLQH